MQRLLCGRVESTTEGQREAGQAEGKQRQEQGGKQFHVVHVQSVPKVGAFMKFQTLAWLLLPGSRPSC